MKPFNIKGFKEYCRDLGYKFVENGESWEKTHGRLMFDDFRKIAYFETDAGEAAIMAFCPDSHIIKNLRNAGTWLAFYEYSAIVA